MKALVRLIKWLIITAVAFVVLAYAVNFSYSLYSDYQADKALTKLTAHGDWQWQSSEHVGSRRSSDVQWRIDEDDTYLLRRVYGNYKVAAWLTKTEYGEMRIHSTVFFLADCKEGTLIETSVTASNGEAFPLKCVGRDWGNELATGVAWSGVDLDDLPRWSQNFDGFKVNENFDSYEWDFQPALRHLTLQSAKPTPSQRILTDEELQALLDEADPT